MRTAINGPMRALLRTATATTIHDINGLPTQPRDGARVQDLLLLLKAPRGGFLCILFGCGGGSSG